MAGWGNRAKGGRSGGVAARAAILSKYAETGGGGFYDEATGASGGERFGTLTFRTAQGQVVGAIDYSVYENQANIQYIQVAPQFQGQGIGKRLLAKLQSSYPRRPVYWGMTTDAGTRLRKSYNKMLKQLG